MADRLEIGSEREELSTRQREVLDAALSLLVESGSQLTMSAVADRASCSKETLYKWFGGRDGLLTATVRWQASRVRPVPVPAEGFDRSGFRDSLEHFARDWLETITGETSVGLNRLAVGEAAGSSGTLGRIVLENGPLAMCRRLVPVLEAGRESGIVAFDDAEEAFRTFFGLVVRDAQIRLLLGESGRGDAALIEADAARAAEQFLTLYGADHAGASRRSSKTSKARKEAENACLL